jgi:hypothetical protein
LVSENDAILQHWIAENGIFFAYRQALRPAAARVPPFFYGNGKNSLEATPGSPGSVTCICILNLNDLLPNNGNGGDALNV